MADAAESAAGTFAGSAETCVLSTITRRDRLITSFPGREAAKTTPSTFSFSASPATRARGRSKMARIRSIHPSLFTDEQFADLSDAAQVFYLGLLTEADDQGIFEWKPVTLRMRLRPTKDGAAYSLLSEIEAAGKIASYEIDGRKYGAIRNFRKFQRPKSPNAIHPTTQHWRIYVGLEKRTSEPPAGKQSPFPQNVEKSPQMEEEGGRREEEGGKREKESDDSAASATDKKRARKSKLPPDWKPTAEQLAYAKAQGCADPADTAERFRLHHQAKGTLGADWNAGFQYWCRNEKNFRSQSATPNGGLKFN